MAILNDLIKEKAQEAIRVVARRVRVRAAYIFGSRVSGTPDDLSDIDVAAFIEDASQFGFQERVRLGVDIREQSGDEVEIHFFPAESLDHPPTASFAAHVLNRGVRL
ncbi:MAG: nucleotidyltransferase domain-containing protein [Thermoguttaceae bacterium]|jgi:predicted nucleotidyltransferase